MNWAHRTQQGESSAEQNLPVLQQKATPSAEETLFSGQDRLHRQQIQQSPFPQTPPRPTSQGISDPRENTFWGSLNHPGVPFTPCEERDNEREGREEDGNRHRRGEKRKALPALTNPEEEEEEEEHYQQKQHEQHEQGLQQSRSAGRHDQGPSDFSFDFDWRSGKEVERTTSLPVLSRRCSNCETESTPVWRKGLTGETLCNACGLHLEVYHTNRPKPREKKDFRRRTAKPKKDV